MKQICEVLEIDYEDIKDKLPESDFDDESILNAESELDEQQTQQAVLDMLENLLKELE